MLANADDAGYFHYRSVIVNRSLSLSLRADHYLLRRRTQIVSCTQGDNGGQREESIPVRAVLYLFFFFFVERRRREKDDRMTNLIFINRQYSNPSQP